MDKFAYCGSVMIFDRCVATNWKAETYAESEKKARSNMAYQYKKKHNLIPGTRVELPGKIERVEEYE